MSILTDDNSNTGVNDEDAVAALMASMVPSKGAAPAASEDDDGDEGAEDDEDQLEASEDDEGAEESDEDESGDEDGEEEGEGAEEAPAATEAPAVTDETSIVVSVNGQDQEFTVGQLKRLAGQEAALTQKSQEADVVGQRAAATLQGALEAVLDDLEAYENVDWLLESRRMDPDEFEWHREQYSKLDARKTKLISNAQTLEGTLKAQRDANMAREAAECDRVLADPNTGIQGWNPELKDTILKFAVSAGLPEGDVKTIVNPSVLKIINQARLYAEGQKATAEKVNLTPKRVRKGGGSETLEAADTKTLKRLETKVRTGRGTDDDATALLMGRWGVKRR